MTAFSTSRPLAGGATDAVKVLADNGAADGDITLMQIAAYAASKGLAPAAGTPLANAINIDGLAATLNAGTYATRAAFRAAARTPAYAGSVPTPADIATLPNFVANPSTVLAGTTLWVASTNSLWLLIVSPTAQAPAAFATLANWVDLGANDGSGNGAVNVQAGALVASPTDAPNADAVIDALAGKAGRLETVTVSVAGNFDLTESAHNGRRVIAAVPGVVFTRTTAWTAAALGCALDVDADGTYSLGTGITVPPGCAAGSASAAGGALDLGCVDGILSSKTAALTAGSSNVRVFNISQAADLNAGSSGDAQVLSIFVPNVASTARFALHLATGGTGAGTRSWALRISSAAVSGTLIAQTGYVDCICDLLLAFAQTAQAAQVGSRLGSGAQPYGATSAGAGRYLAAVDSTNGIYLNLWLAKATAADVASIQSGQLVVTQP